MQQHLPSRGTFLGLLLQDMCKEVPQLNGTCHHLELFSYDPAKLIFMSDVKDIPSCNQLKSHGPECPDVNLLIVFLPHEDLGREVERGATKSLSELSLFSVADR